MCKTLYQGINFLLFVAFIFLPAISFASIEITEIMYDLEGSDSKREWVEIYNSGAEQVDLTGWKLYENETNHKLTEQGSTILPVGRYAIIADDVSSFLSEHPDFSGVLFDSAFSLKNSGETLILRNENLEDIDIVVYDTEIGADGDGNSLQKVSGLWLAGSPTPGKANIDSGQNSQEDNKDDENNQDNNHQEENQNSFSGGALSFPVEPQIFAFAGSDRNVVVGADTLFSGKALGLEKEPLTNARYMWNFGDGETKEGKSVFYNYKYPGTYSVILSVSSGEYSAVDKMKVIAEPANVIVSDIEYGQNGFIEIFNRSNKELDISFWQIKAGVNKFIIPEYTRIFANTKVKFSTQITKLVLSDNDIVRLHYPNGVEVKSFLLTELKPESEVKKVTEEKPKDSKPEKKSVAETQIKNLLQKSETDLIKNNKQKQLIIPQTVAATVLQAEQNKSLGAGWFLVVIAIVILSVASVLFVYMKEKKDLNLSKEAQDIEILD